MPLILGLDGEDPHDDADNDDVMDSSLMRGVGADAMADIDGYAWAGPSGWDTGGGVFSL